MGSFFSRCKDRHFRGLTTRPAGQLQEVASLYCAAVSTTPETIPEATQQWKMLSNRATKGEALDLAFVEEAW